MNLKSFKTETEARQFDKQMQAAKYLTRFEAPTKPKARDIQEEKCHVACKPNLDVV